jgi:hypothetical protein
VCACDTLHGTGRAGEEPGIADYCRFGLIQGISFLKG